MGSVSFEREAVANHASNLAANVRGNLRRSLESIGVVRPTPFARAPFLSRLRRPAPRALRPHRRALDSQDILNGNGKLVGPHKVRDAACTGGAMPR